METDSETLDTTTTTASRDGVNADPCTWLSDDAVRRVIGRHVEPGSNEPSIPLCTYTYTSDTGVLTDLVVGPWNDAVVAEPVDDFSLPNHGREIVSGLGDQAVFLRAATLDDGNNVLLVKSEDRSLLIGGEFLTREQAVRLADLVLAGWA
jgi:hypothetical protein